MALVNFSNFRLCEGPLTQHTALFVLRDFNVCAWSDAKLGGTVFHKNYKFEAKSLQKIHNVLRFLFDIHL